MRNVIFIRRMSLAIAAGFVLSVLPGCNNGGEDPAIFKPVDASKASTNSADALVKVTPKKHRTRVRR